VAELITIYIKMNDQIQTIQIKLDETKERLKSNPEYATLSGLNILPRNWVIEPYLYSIETGISAQVSGENYVTDFNFEFRGKIKKHYIDERPCESESNTTLVTRLKMPEGTERLLSDYSEEEKNTMAEQSKIFEKIEEHMIKRAEFDFFETTLEFILRED